MKIARAVTDVRGVARNSTRNRFTIEHDYSSDAAPPKLDCGRQPGWTGADDSNVDVDGHLVPIHSLIDRPSDCAASAHTLAAQ